MTWLRFGAAMIGLVLAGAVPAYAQDTPHGTHGDSGDMSGMDMPGMEQEQPAQQNEIAHSGHPAQADDDGHADRAGHDMADMDMPMVGIFGSYPATRDASGTSWQPDAATHAGIHLSSGEWSAMGHLRLTGVYDTQSGHLRPSGGGDDKFFVEGMAMVSVQRDYYGGDLLNLRAALSPDPFMGKSGYPLLFASGETANGATTLIDRQHPHELVMELSASFTHYLSAADSVFAYVGYPGEPALGPPSFMHRMSGMDIPSAPITHHWLDSTHIVFGVATAGFVHRNWKVEVSQFTGREPDQQRFDFDPIRLDSTSARLSWNPDPNWSLQASWGSLHSPEQLAPRVNENRFTASATYVTPLGDGGFLAATLAWGLKQESPGPDLNGVLLETEYKPSDPWTLFARAEWEENAELSPLGRVEKVSTLNFGAIRDLRIAEHWKVGLGALYAFDFVPSALKSSYGSDPHGAMVFVRLIAE